ncbi:MAG: biopolymer transporter ExbD, partial [Bacteroidota bacterium]
RNNDLFVNQQFAQISDIKDKLKEFMLNPNNDPTLSEQEDVEIEGLGKITRSKGVVSLQNDRGTDYGAYISVQNELVRGLNELREEFSMNHFGKKFDKLTEVEQDLVKKAIPTAISEAEPLEIKQ